MPTKPIVLRRWQVVAAFVLLCLSMVAVTVYGDFRLDEAEGRITTNAGMIARQQTNARESLVRDRKICQETNKVKAQLVVALERSLATTPTIAYYREHPAELEAALASIRKTIGEFAPSVCPPAPR